MINYTAGIYATIPEFTAAYPSEAAKVADLPASASVITHTTAAGETTARVWYEGRVLLKIAVNEK
jgi:hypothetical protein